MNENRKNLFYLAVPYSDPDPKIRHERFMDANKAAGELMRQGYYVFSPISHAHPIAEAGGLPTGWDYWRGYDTTILSMCGAVFVLKLPGWERSEGVRREIEIARQMKIPVHFIDKL